MSTQVRITLQDEIYRRAKRLAEMSNREVEELLAQAIELSFSPVSETGGDYPTNFSPDGNQILFSAGQHQSREIYAIGLDGSGRRRLTNWLGADAPNAWLPDGRIVFGHYTGDAARPRW